MAKFTMGETVPADEVFAAKLGSNTIANGGGLTDADVGKPVKQVADSIYDLCAEGDAIEGFLLSLEPAPIDGYSFGSILFDVRKKAKLQGAVPMNGRGFVVAGNQGVARNVKLVNGLPVVKAVADQTAPGLFPWRLVSGAGTDGSVGVIEFIY